MERTAIYVFAIFNLIVGFILIYGKTSPFSGRKKDGK